MVFYTVTIVDPYGTTLQVTCEDQKECERVISKEAEYAAPMTIMVLTVQHSLGKPLVLDRYAISETGRLVRSTPKKKKSSR